ERRLGRGQRDHRVVARPCGSGRHIIGSPIRPTRPRAVVEAAVGGSGPPARRPLLARRPDGPRRQSLRGRATASAEKPNPPSHDFSRDTKNAERNTKNAESNTKNAERNTKNAESNTKNAERKTKNAESFHGIRRPE